MEWRAAERELRLKVVYAGPSGAGKTANVRELARRIPPDARGELMLLGDGGVAGTAAQGRSIEPTLFFDLLPVFFTTTDGVAVRLRIYAAPGAEPHAATRRLVLQGTDAVVFVADGRRSEAPANNRAWADLLTAIDRVGLDRTRLAIVVQLNKLDLPGAPGPDELPATVPGADAVFGAAATRGEGVADSLLGAMSAALRRLATAGDLEAGASGVDQEALVAALRRQLAG